MKCEGGKTMWKPNVSCGHTSKHTCLIYNNELPKNKGSWGEKAGYSLPLQLFKIIF